MGPRLTPGFFANTLGTVVINISFYTIFFRRLAFRYPEREEEIMKVAKLLNPFHKRNEKKMKELNISIYTVVMYVIEGEPEAEQINREWLNGLRWGRYSFIGLVAHLPLLLIFSKWVVLVRESVWSYFHIFGR